MSQADSVIIAALNEPQLKAVTAPHGHHLVLAGAGSGKTRVLVHRIAWLIKNQGVSPYGILALTFTNKAAKQMRNRLEDLLEHTLPGVWVGTFHGICHRFLRTHWQEAKLAENFQIIDAQDQLSIIKKIQKELNLSDQKWPPKKTQHTIQSYKAKGLRAEDMTQAEYFYEQKCQEVYQIYQDYCHRSSSVDFIELILRTLEVLNENTAIQAQYHERFGHILIDEFQDTNPLQYKLLKAFASPQAEVMAVGDDDQSIYSWRGARIDHIFKFEKEFTDCTTIKLEQNYRSTKTILEAANAVIANNQERLGKALWTEADRGDTIKIFTAYNDLDEARYLARQAFDWQQQGGALSDVAILYRSNAQSRVLEDQLTQAAIPYRIYGGLKFFDRAEIKDILCYCRLLVSRSDDAAFERIVNKPTRGIGQATIQKLRTKAQTMNCSLWQAIADTELNKRAQNALTHFTNIIQELDHNCQNLKPSEKIALLMEQTGLIDFYQQEEQHTYQIRIENMQELINAAKAFEADNDQDIVAFLASICLDSSDSEQDKDNIEKIQLMTIHAAKGLEFKAVFLSGMEEGLFPHQMSLKESGLEEERRLCYVAMTRAKEKLIISHALSRRLNGMETMQQRSRFIGEIPRTCYENIQDSKYTSQSASHAHQVKNTHTYPQHTNTHLAKFRLGQTVNHPHFGVGTILNCEGTDSQARVQIKFEKVGVKWLMLSHAPLSID